jgi:hypothetical protein
VPHGRPHCQEQCNAREIRTTNMVRDNIRYLFVKKFKKNVKAIQIGDQDAQISMDCFSICKYEYIRGFMLSTCEKFNCTNLYFPFSENKKKLISFPLLGGRSTCNKRGKKLHLAAHKLKFHQRGKHLLGFIRLSFYFSA